MSLIQPTRRQFIRGAALLFAAPVIVRAANIMQVRVLREGMPSLGIYYWAEDRPLTVFKIVSGRDTPIEMTPAEYKRERALIDQITMA
jgi:hypothetical protein